MTTVTLCGSARFESGFIEANKELTLRGLTVISLGVLPRDAGGEKNWYTPDQKMLLDLVHLDKILCSDSILVVGDGYIGESTCREIVWATLQRKNTLRVCDFESWDDIASAIFANLTMPNAASWAISVLRGEDVKEASPASRRASSQALS